MKKTAIAKDIFREIWKTKSRFLSIFAIIAIGTGFFAGLKATCPDMKYTAQQYYTEYRLMDIRLLSTYGINEEDIAAVRGGVDNVEQIQPGYSVDALVNTGESAETVVKVLSLSDAQQAQEGINLPRLVEGRFPEAANECVVENNLSSPENFKIGNTIALESGKKDPLTDTLEYTEYQIVGVVESPMYVNFQRGSSDIGTGKVNSYLMVPEQNFKLDVYTELYVTFSDTQGLNPFEEEYGQLIAQKCEQLEKVAASREAARYQEVLGEANSKLDEAKKELEDGRKTQQEELKKARAQLEDGRRQLEDGRAQYEKSLAEFDQKISDAQQQLEDTDALLKEQSGKLEETQALYLQLDELFRQPPAQLTPEVIALVQQSSALDENLPQLFMGYLTTRDPSLQAMLQQAMQAVSAALDSSRQQLSSAYTQLETGRSELEAQRADGQAQLEKAKAELDRSEQELADGEAEYLEQKAESERKLSNAEQEIRDAEQEIAEIKQPVWYIFDRGDNLGYTDFGNDAEKVDNISSVFPVFFILVAALVCLTTMTRMVEEHRTQVGTLKALGYSKPAIMSKYLVYAVLASLFGSAVGLSVGMYLFPTVIFNAYSIMYIFPPLSVPLRWDYAFWCTLAAVLCTSFSAFFATYKELFACPAELMRPKAPKAGKRILLEKITPVWSHLNFIKKVTMRNLFRYKKRMLMTVIGIAGCTALMLTGFGLKHSISAIVERQYGNVFVYDAMIMQNEEAGQEDKDALEQQLQSNSEITESLNVRQEQLTYVGAERNADVYLFVPEKTERLSDFIRLQDRTSRQPVAFPEEGAVITEKLSRLFGISAGEQITLRNSDNREVSVTVAGITENYTFNYVYLSPACYEDVFGESYRSNTILFNMEDSGEETENRISSELVSNGSVLSVTFSEASTKTFRDMISSLNYIVLVLIISAGALALVVLYNLTNINVNERIRELATIKVLGFYDKEVSSYIYRENNISAFIGILFGLIGGIFLHHFVVQTAEIDFLMFAPEVDWFSFVASALLTAVFTLIVNCILHFRLKKIDMVESLKSIE